MWQLIDKIKLVKKNYEFEIIDELKREWKAIIQYDGKKYTVMQLTTEEDVDIDEVNIMSEIIEKNNYFL